MGLSVHNSYLLVNMGQLRRNVKTILGELPRGVELIPVLKDDAYGMGLLSVGRALSGCPGIRTIAVSHISEGLALREVWKEKDVLVMGGVPSFFVPAALEQGLTLAVGRLGLLPVIGCEAANMGLRAKVQVKVETGLNRMGVAPGDELDHLVAELRRWEGHLEVTGAFSHFADLSNLERTETQFQRYLAAAKQLEGAGIAIPCRHISGSAAWEGYPQYHLDAVRIGRRLYMDHPTNPRGNICEMASWRSYITNLRLLKAGEDLGYGGEVHLERDALVATVGVGYGDGLNRALAEAGAPVLVRGKRARLLAMCMDQCFLDVTGIDCQVDDETTFFGYDSRGNFLSSQQVSLLAGQDEGCGLISALSPRVERIYQEA